MEMKQNVSKSETILSSKQKKNVFGFLAQTKKKYFRFFDQKKKTFLDSPTRTRHFHDQILSVIIIFSWSIVSAGRLFQQQKVGHGNETKCFEIRNNSFIQTKKKCFWIPHPKQKK